MGQDLVHVPDHRPQPGRDQRRPQVEHVLADQHRGHDRPPPARNLAGGQQRDRGHRQSGQKAQGLAVDSGQRQQYPGELDGADQPLVAGEAHRRVLDDPLGQVEHHHPDHQKPEVVVHPGPGVEDDPEDQKIDAHHQRRVDQVPELAQSGVHVQGPQVLGRHHHGELPPPPYVSQVVRDGRRDGQIDQRGPVVAVGHKASLGDGARAAGNAGPPVGGKRALAGSGADTTLRLPPCPARCGSPPSPPPC